MSNSIKLKLLKTLLVFSLLLVSSNMEAKSNPFIKLFRSYFPIHTPRKIYLTLNPLLEIPSCLS